MFAKTHIRLKLVRYSLVLIFAMVYTHIGRSKTNIEQEITMSDKKELWITSAEAAAILTENSWHPISDSYVRRLGINGKLSSKMIGRKTRLFNRAEVEAYTVKQRAKREAA